MGQEKAKPPENEYYQVAADVIKIFWEFCKLRMNQDGVPFCGVNRLDSEARRTVRVAFDPAWEVERRNIDSTGRALDIITLYGQVLTESLLNEWELFTRSELSTHLPEKYKSFVRNPEVVTLLWQAEELANKHSMVASSFSGVMRPALHTGATTTSQLSAILDREFHRMTALVMSKVSLDFIPEARSRIGLADPEEKNQVVDHALINPDEKFKLDRELLKKFGYGSTGCPAGNPASAAKMELLRKILPAFGVSKPSKEVMLLEFTDRVLQDLATITQWYSSLTDEQKIRYVSVESRKLLDGTTLEDIKRERKKL